MRTRSLEIAALPVPREPSGVAFLKITPIVISLVLDYTKGFGHMELVSIDA